MAQSPSKSADILRQFVVLLAVIVTIAFNGLSQSIPIGGRTSAEVSNTYATYFTPANYAFAIWGVIYLLLLAYGIYQALPAQRENPYARKIGWLFVLSCALNCVWLVLFQSDQITLSLIVIVAFLVTLMAIYVRLDIGRVQVSSSDRWLLQLPFSVYLGWLSVATIANASVLGVALKSGDLLGISGPTWAAIMLVVATLVGIVLVVTRRDWAYILVFVWAFTAIISKQAGIAVVTNTATATVVVLIVVTAVSLFLNRHSPTRAYN